MQIISLCKNWLEIYQVHPFSLKDKKIQNETDGNYFQDYK